MIGYLILILIVSGIIFGIGLLINYIYLNFTKKGKAINNYLKHKENEFINKWGDK